MTPSRGTQSSPLDARQLAFQSLRAIYSGAYADVALHRALTTKGLAELDRHLVTELVYGCVRRQRTLDALIDQLGRKPAQQQPPELRIILHLGFYQLRYLDHIPASAAVNTSVNLAKQNGYSRLSGVVNGILRGYARQQPHDPLQLPTDPIQACAVDYSFPDWMMRLWWQQLGSDEARQLCDWLNQPPHIDLRINPLKTSLEAVEVAFQTAGIETVRLPGLPQALRLRHHQGSIPKLPGYDQGWWMVQDSSGQLVGQLLAPQAGQVVIDACAAPGGKATHLAELMQDQGQIWACDRTGSRLRKIQQNARRLGLTAIKTYTGDSRHQPKFHGQADRVLVDAPCSGLGTLHRHADARWRQTPETIQDLSQLQQDLLTEAARWLQPTGRLVYATCTLHPAENEAIVEQFLQTHPDWQIEPPSWEIAAVAAVAPQGWVKVWPHRHHMDGFFMVALERRAA
ncbi:16S rRNA (cytosine(967)-C(5))-methyltransferase [Halomicronema hongdechloris]|uniref:16S rRNA (cytosine(967)-C(5))-methyltransferase n=1 Tax=Halomicronema hongdechloris TaxID=1209493 RepID=UPI0009B94FF7|nr:16S rRNA (cytosine(967)-C(5))-methyltransferase [Halomicronema hongdechloris]